MQKFGMKGESERVVGGVWERGCAPSAENVW